MSHFTVRRLLIDLEAPFDRHWCGGDAFVTALFNALSMSFPVGEQFFIDSVRGGFRQLPAARQAEMKEAIDGFIGQEATHRKIHGLFNRHLEKQGLVNAWAPRVLRRLARHRDVDIRHYLALTASYEHFTAIFSDWMLRHAHWLDQAEPRLKTMWLWHSSEESEHKSLAFDLYQAVGGNHAWRVRWFRRVTFFFLTDMFRQTALNLQTQGELWKWKTWRSAARFLFGRGGLFRDTFPAWRAYFRRDFHPAQQDTALASRWLAENAAQYTVVGGAQSAKAA